MFFKSLICYFDNKRSLTVKIDKNQYWFYYMDPLPLFATKLLFSGLNYPIISFFIFGSLIDGQLF